METNLAITAQCGCHLLSSKGASIATADIANPSGMIPERRGSREGWLSQFLKRGQRNRS